jgi:rod shape-determining protein MreD
LVIYALAFTLALVAQTTAFHFTRGAAPWPDLALLLLVYGALRMGKMGGVKLGLAAGFAEDMLSYGVLGANTCAKSLIGFGMGKLREDLISDSATSRALFTTAATAVDALIYGALSRTFTDQAAFSSIGTVILSSAAVNVLFALPVMGVMEWAEDRIMRFGDASSRGKYNSPSLD